METLLVPGPLPRNSGMRGLTGLVMMFAEAHRIATDQLDRRMTEESASFERRLNDEISKFRVEMIERMSDLRFDLLKWNLLFWIGQLAAFTAILNFMLRDVR